MRVSAALLMLALVIAPEPVLAHPPPLGVRGFWGGVLHPVFVTDHVTGILALGLLTGSQDRWGFWPLLAYAGALALGLAAMTTGIVPRLANEAVLGTAVAAGLLVALGRPLNYRARRSASARIAAAAIHEPRILTAIRAHRACG